MHLVAFFQIAEIFGSDEVSPKGFYKLVRIQSLAATGATAAGAGSNGFKAANRLVAKAEVGKEYLLCVGRHASIVRKHPEEGWQYLELQSPTSNGYQRLTVQVLKNRFGCPKSHTLFKKKLEVRSSMIDIEQLQGDDFKEILSYINTAPDKRFRRVRNKEGKLVLSQPMKNFHPGRGVYRSSYKNALRLAATETNSAYRLADAKRWENMRFITGIEIKRSPANRGPCVICDSMKGEYPKDFVFTGWHPACWCIAVPIMMDDDDFIDLLVDNKTSSSVKQIEDIPEGAKEFINSNEKYLKLMSVQDNKGWFERKSEEDEFPSRYKGIEFRTLYRGKNGGEVETFTTGKQLKQEWAKNENALRILADKGYKYRLLPVIEDGDKNPDAFNLETRKKADLKITDSNNGKNIVQNALKEANRQKVNEVVIRFNKELVSNADVYRTLKTTFQQDRVRKIQTVILITHENEVIEVSRSPFKITKR